MGRRRVRRDHAPRAKGIPGNAGRARTHLRHIAEAQSRIRTHNIAGARRARTNALINDLARNTIGVGGSHKAAAGSPESAESPPQVGVRFRFSCPR